MAYPFENLPNFVETRLEQFDYDYYQSQDIPTLTAFQQEWLSDLYDLIEQPAGRTGRRSGKRLTRIARIIAEKMEAANAR